MPQTLVRPYELGRDLSYMGISIARDIIFPCDFQTVLGRRFDIAWPDGQWDVGGSKELLTGRGVNTLLTCTSVSKENEVKLFESAIYPYRQSFLAR
jgi:hypothetical protein